MARKTKGNAGTETAAKPNLDNGAMVASNADTASKTPRSRRAPTAKAAPAPKANLESGGNATHSTAAKKPIAGKLGQIATAVNRPAGASIDELTKTTGWQPHTVRAALTRLRQRGIDAKLTTIDERKVYRVAEAGA